MNKEERLKVVFEAISKIAGFEIKPYKDFYIVINDRKDVYRINENLNLLYKTPDGSFGITSYNTLSILNGGYNLEEIKEPLITDEERNFLRQFKFEWLSKSTSLYMFDKSNMIINVISLTTISVSFDGLKEDRKYSGKELGL